ncbi:MAG: GNAT family N-acetyltransferase, partial [Roseovarius sp.]
MTEEFQPARDGDQDEIIALWTRAGMLRPWNRPDADIAAIRANPKSALLVARADGTLVATVAVEDGGHRAWVYYLCSAPDLRGQGWGRRAIAAAEAWACRNGQFKIQLLVRRSNAP